MFSGLFKGELPLKITFWKFACLGLAILKLCNMFFLTMMEKYITNMTILRFYTKHFHMVYSPKLSLLWALFYLFSIFLILVFSWNIVLGVWRSANNYDKSVWLRFLAKASILILVFTTINSISASALFYLGL